ncbi:MAG: M16 family metallopeptidase [Tepidiformaceae bacterium]
MSGDGHADILPFEATETTLPNGLRVIVVPTGFPNLVSLQIPVQTGSRNEVEPGKSGFAHFFEHVMFRGTERFSSEAYQEIVTRTGARQNAYTTDDYTNYHMTFAREDLETVLELEADRFMNLRYSEEDFKTEARAVLGEYNKNSADPLNKLIEVQRDAAYTTHTYKHTTMGFISDIEDMPNQFAYSLTFFDRWYRPEYTTVIVAGDVEPAATVALVEKFWGAWRSGDAAPTIIPQEPPAEGPVTAHVPWSTATLPWVTVAFHGPAFSSSQKDYAALDTLLDLWFGETSDLYQQLVERDQLVDQLFPYNPSQQDPGLATIMARVKQLEDVGAVRDAILATVARARTEPVTAERLEDAKSNSRYGFARTLDNSESIAATLARYVRFERSYDTLNALFRVFDSLTTDDLLAAATRYLTDSNMVVTTLSREALPQAILDAPPALVTFAPKGEDGPQIPVVALPSKSALISIKLLFTAGSAHDPAGKEGLAALAASMITDAGSKRRRIDEINRALFPMAGSLHARVDREMTTFSGSIHLDNLSAFADIVLPQLLDSGYREEDFARLKSQQLNEVVQDLRANNEEELGKERLQQDIFAGTAYGHPSLGSVAGIESITLDDVRAFVDTAYTRANLTIGLAGDVPSAFTDRLQRELASLPAGAALPAPQVAGRQPNGLEIEIIAKDTRATAISLGWPTPVTRSDPDFAALWLARAWLGEHRASNGRLYQRIREIRGMNYGDYAYIEAFPGGMYGFFPAPNLARRAQLFEVWIRPVRPEQAVIALKIALHELEQLSLHGLAAQDFEDTRQYLSKNVFVMTKTQEQQLGYALDSRWYGIGEFTAYMREQLASLTLPRVNDVIKRYVSAENAFVVAVSGDAEALRAELLSRTFTAIRYDAPKPEELLIEDRLIGARQLNLRPESVRITPVEDVFAS